MTNPFNYFHFHIIYFLLVPLHTHLPSASVHLKLTISSELWYTNIIKYEIIQPHILLSKHDGTDSCHKILCGKELPVV